MKDWQMLGSGLSFLTQVIKMVLLTENLEKDNEWSVLDYLKHQCSHNTCHDVSDTDAYWTDWQSELHILSSDLLSFN